MTWLAGRGGRRVELLHPEAHEVDFAEIAHALAQINRYAGHTDVPVSVGKHTLLMVDALDAFVAAKTMDAALARALRPHVLLHDAHETRLGDWTTPVKHTLWAAAAEVYGDQGRLVVAATLRRLVERHDRAIYAAARLAPPSATERKLVMALDVSALKTERAAFWTRMAGAPAWDDLVEAAPALPAPRRTLATLGPDEVGIRLLTEFQATLPVFRKDAR